MAKSNIKCIAGMMKFAYKYANNKNYHYKKWTSKKSTHLCPLCHKGSGKGWNCIGYASAILFHGGNVKTVKCSCDGLLTNNFAKYSSLSLSKWKKRNGDDWIQVYKNTKPAPESLTKPGDIIIRYEKGVYKHTAVKGRGKNIYDATRTYGIKERKYSALKGGMIIYRYIGKQEDLTDKQMAYYDMIIKHPNVVKYKVTASTLRTRTKPSINASVVTKLNKGDTCYVIPNYSKTVTEIRKSTKKKVKMKWYKVVCDGKVCYTRAKYLTKVTN